MEIARTGPPGAAPAENKAAAGPRLERLAPGERLRNEGALFALLVAVLAASFALPALRSRHLLPGIPCLFRTVTGLPCLLCGMTRSFVFTAHGDIAEALRMHMLGPPLFFLAAAACVYLAGVLATGYRVKLGASAAVRRAFSWSVLGVFVLVWILKLVFLRAYW